MNTVEVLGYRVLNESADQVLNRVNDWVNHPGGFHLITLNPEMIVQASGSQTHHAWIKNADLCIADGVGLSVAYRFGHGKTLQRVPGVDLVKMIFQKQQWSVYCIGSTETVLEALSTACQKEFPNLNLIGLQHGYYDSKNERHILEDIKKKQPDVVLIGMGFPRQEALINRLKPHVSKGLVIGVGGSFDVLSGLKKRGPIWMQRMGLEWVWRFMSEPTRLKRLPRLFLFIWVYLRYAKKESVHAKK